MSRTSKFYCPSPVPSRPVPSKSHPNSSPSPILTLVVRELAFSGLSDPSSKIRVASVSTSVVK